MAAAFFCAVLRYSSAEENSLASPGIIKPAALRRGDKIGIVAPASSFNREGFTAGCDRLRQMGYEPVFSESIFERDLYFAGTLDRRLREFEQMLTREDVVAIICARGGYGSNYLLEKLSFEMITAHPKIFLGCSDVTSLLTAISDRTGLITFHGPMIAKDIASPSGIELSSWEHALQGANSWGIPTTGVEVLQQGRAAARLYGGCLSLLVASLGTDFEINTNDTILFIEDVAEKPYRIDRMLMQLRLAGKLDQVGGLIFGEMLDCVQPGGQDYTLQQVIMRVLKDFRGPVVYGLKSGHVSSGNITLPIGVRAELVADGGGAKLRILEAATLL
jgi:muramoyltetrapeptide carboxypeptidase